MKGQKYPVEILTQAEVGKLLAACSTTCATGARHRALIAVLYRSGLRISEALSLYEKDVDPDRKCITILHGKNDKSRLVSLDEGTVALIAEWKKYRSKLGLTRIQPLFCTCKGQALDTGYIRKTLPKLARKAGIEKRVHAHCLRHTHAFQLAQENVPLIFIQQQLGHSNANVTSRYISHLNPVERLALIGSREW